MSEFFGIFGRNRLTTFGAVLVFAGLFIFVSLVVADMAGAIRNEYVNIIVYFGIPLVMVVGMAIVPIGVVRHRKYVQRRGEDVDPYFRFDFNDPKFRHKAWYFAGFTGFISVSLLTAAYQGTNFMETTEFCGETCHTVMEPEYVAYLRSPHARVSCVDCHIGPGLPWLLRQKFTGLRQSWHTITGTYERPVSSPVKNLRPAREVCEVCHWPNRFYGDRVKLFYTFTPDETNTPNLTRVMLHIGHHAAESTGIHSHIAKEVWYVTSDKKRMEMSWVYDKKPDGSVVTWVPEGKNAPANIGPKAPGARRMDCVDCHNRSAHKFSAYDELVDDAITRGDIKGDLPWIKKLAMDAAPEITKPISFREQREVVDKLQAIPRTYETQYPDVFKGRKEDIHAATARLVTLYRQTSFPAMRVYPNMQTDLKTHEGCFRCHGSLVAASGPRKGETLSDDCELCHNEPEELTGAAAKPR